MKHWREDWTYEDRSMLLYTDKKNWARTDLSAKIKGKMDSVVFRLMIVPVMKELENGLITALIQRG